MQAQDNNIDVGSQQRNMTAPAGFNQQKTMAVHDHAAQENVHCTEDNCEYQIRGR